MRSAWTCWTTPYAGCSGSSSGWACVDPEPGATRALSRSNADAPFDGSASDRRTRAGAWPAGRPPPRWCCSRTAGSCRCTATSASSTSAGPFATDTRALLGTWVFDGAEAAVSPAAALAERLGADSLLVSDGGFGDLTVRNADRADVTVALVGEHPSRNGEDHCLPSADLPVGQLDLLRQLTALGKPLVVVVVTGRPLELRPVLQLADAVLVAWHPGSAGGPALADVLVGAESPAGRLPMGLPRLARPGVAGTAERPTGRRLGRSRDANFGRFFSALDHPELSLGFGLAYTTFAYSELELSRDTLPVRGGVVRASVEVANTGRRAGREVVQLYIRDLVADVVRPVIELADWRLVDLEPGRSTKVVFKITADLFGYWDRDLTYRVDPGDVDVIIGPNSARGSSARVTITS